jgi:putative transposase
MKEMNGRITICPFSLLPNHYHFLLTQVGVRDMEHFMRSVITSYGRYFCSKYNHSGHIFEGPYKAVLLKTKQDIWRVRKYILSNPSEAGFYNWPHVGLEI